ncbi:MAG: hypothetical protein L0Z53_11600, partial [Acidobacteriales bacterium]|nr:hypothetical protein [Terriglobales bacterium]
LQKDLRVIMSISARRRAPWLWLLLGLFCLRVTGQMLVAFWGVSFLPPMSEWQSGLLPYPVLLISQLLIIALLAKVASDFTRERGYFAIPNARLGTGALCFGWIYLTAMVARYPIRMTLHPEARWFGGTIPIFFHWVLASFVLIVGYYHQRAASASATATGAKSRL